MIDGLLVGLRGQQVSDQTTLSYIIVVSDATQVAFQCSNLRRVPSNIR